MKQFLKNCVLFKNLNDQQLEKISEMLHKRFYKKGENVFLEQESGNILYIVFQGLIRIYKLSRQGSEKTLALLEKGDYFGEMALLDDNSRSASAQALEDSVLLTLDNNNFHQLISNNPEMATNIITTLSYRLREANQQIEDLTFHDVRARLTSTLEKLEEKYGIQKKEGVLIEKKITHQELANMAGTTRATATKILNKMARDGDLKFKDGLILIKN